MRPSEHATLSEWLAYIDTGSWQNVDMGLQRLQQMLAKMKIDRPAPHIITVAGTNGKGSTCYACEALLLAHGLKVGTALSPHIDRFNERIRLNGAEATDREIVAALAAVESSRGDEPLTYFEYCVLASFWFFLEAKVDVAVLEIGLGGRLDGFNVVPADTAVITSIGLDHQLILGPDRETIGEEKAGILFPEQHKILGQDMPQSVLQRCREVGGGELRFGRDIRLELKAQQFSVVGETFTLEGVRLTSLAPHNLALAIAAVADHIQLDPPRARDAIEQLQIRGRLERRQWRGRHLVLDVAHNPEGAKFLWQELSYRDIVPTVICCAMLKDKQHLEFYQVVAENFSGPWLLLDTDGERGMSAQALNNAIGGIGRCQDGADIEVFLDSATEPTDVILGLGSFSLVQQLLIGVPGHA